MAISTNQNVSPMLSQHKKSPQTEEFLTAN
jgi:hypothetical protein